MTFSSKALRSNNDTIKYIMVDNLKEVKQKGKVHAQELHEKPRIVVLGVGGCGNNALSHLAEKSAADSITLIGCNTDTQDLSKLNHHESIRRIQIGIEATQGLGAGGNFEQGELAAEESIQEVMDAIKGAHMLFIAGGEGGGTFTGAAPVIARRARDEEGILTIAVATTPFTFEGPERMANAQAGLERLQDAADILVVIPNENLQAQTSADKTLRDAFKEVDDILASFVSSMTRIIVRSGLVNVDFADIRAALSGFRARAMFGVGEADLEEGMALGAAERALSSPLLGQCSLENAPSVIVSVEGGSDIRFQDYCVASSRIGEEIGKKVPCKAVYGAYANDPELEGKIRVTVLATLPLVSKYQVQDLQKLGVRHDVDTDFTNQTRGKQVSFNEDRDEYQDDLLCESKRPKKDHDDNEIPEAWWARFVTSCKKRKADVQQVHKKRSPDER